MRNLTWARQSPAILVAVLALVAGVTGAAVANPSAKKAVSKKKVKKIADKRIAKAAPGLSVAHADTASSADRAGNASRFNGQGAASFLRYNTAIPHGVTIKGVFGAEDNDTDTGGDPFPSSRDFVSFPLPAPANLADDTVNFAPTPNFTADEDPACTGDVDAPTAPAGKVCLYVGGSAATDAQALAGCCGGPSRLGFAVVVSSSSDTRAFVAGTWAYTAP